MKNYKYTIITFTAWIYILSSCISSFETVGDKDLEGALVVEGVILEEGTKITLSRTIKLSDELPENYLFDGVSNATIRIIDEAQNVIAVAEAYDWGKYIVKERFSFVPDMKYALDIQIGTRHYQSVFAAPVNTPEIDEVSWKLNNDNSIDIMVSTHSFDNETLYCFWNFEENWEIRSRYFGNLRYDPITDALIPQSLIGDNRYYCWSSDYSKSLLLASSEKLKDAEIKNHKIHTLQPGNSRYSYLYSITVRQYRLNREASLYFTNLQKNIDESGSLFAPQPSEMTGNIRCLSDPDELVIGYIFASKATSSRLFIPMVERNLNNFEEQTICEENQFSDPRTAYSQGYGIGGNSYVALRCVDCTQRSGRPTKTKPDFWPNDHQ